MAFLRRWEKAIYHVERERERILLECISMNFIFFPPLRWKFRQHWNEIRARLENFPTAKKFARGIADWVITMQQLLDRNKVKEEGERRRRNLDDFDSSSDTIFCISIFRSSLWRCNNWTLSQYGDDESRRRRRRHPSKLREKWDLSGDISISQPPLLMMNFGLGYFSCLSYLHSHCSGGDRRELRKISRRDRSGIPLAQDFKIRVGDKRGPHLGRFRRRIGFEKPFTPSVLTMGWTFSWQKITRETAVAAAKKNSFGVVVGLGGDGGGGGDE